MEQEADSRYLMLPEFLPLSACAHPVGRQCILGVLCERIKCERAVETHNDLTKELNLSALLNF